MNEQDKERLKKLCRDTDELLFKASMYVHDYYCDRYGYDGELTMVGGSPITDEMCKDLMQHTGIAHQVVWLLEQYLEHGMTKEVEASYGKGTDDVNTFNEILQRGLKERRK